MLNALYDFDNFGKFEPYVGAGIGIVDTKGSFAAHDFTGTAGELVLNPTCVGNTPGRDLGQGATCGISDSDRGFGWQLLAGLGYELTDNLTWDTHYTYLNAPDADLDGFITNSATGEFSEITADLDNVAAHTVLTGLRYTFGGHDHAPTPVAAAPEPVFSHNHNHNRNHSFVQMVRRSLLILRLAL